MCQPGRPGTLMPAGDGHAGEPAVDGFTSKQTLRAGQKFNLAAFPEIYLEVDDFLPVGKD